jgi:hypothetical protein
VSATAQARKDQIISGLVETRRKILDAAASLPSERQDEVFLGVWSARDLLAHLVGWDFTNIQATEEILAGKLPSFYSHHDRDWETYNARLVAEHKTEDFADLIASVEDSSQKLIDFLETVSAEEFDKDRGIRFKRYKVTIARLLQPEIDDEKTHYMQIKEFGDREVTP